VPRSYYGKNNSVKPQVAKPKPQPRQRHTGQPSVVARHARAAVRQSLAGNQDNTSDRLSLKPPSEILLGLLDPAEMKKPEQDAIWTLIMHFKGKGQ
jgi:hypothetical protein